MALRHELLKSSAVAMVALSYVFGCCPLPFASAVAVGAIQSYSLLTCVVGCLTPSKIDKVSAEEKPDLTVAAEFLANSSRTCARAIVDRAAVRNAVWIVLAILFKRAMVVTGLSSSPLLVAALATSVGALSYSTATALAASGRHASAVSPYGPAFWRLEQEKVLEESVSPYDPAFWRLKHADMSEESPEEMLEESPLAILAQTDPLILQLPLIDMEG